MHDQIPQSAAIADSDYVILAGQAIWLYADISALSGAILTGK